MKVSNRLLLASYLLYCSCSSADLKPNSSSILQDGPTLEEVTSSLRLECEADEKIYQGVDTWHDSIPYLFTPLKSKVTKYSLSKTDRITFQSEKVKVILNSDTSSLDKIYVESLLLYSDFFAQLCKPLETEFFHQSKFASFDKIALYLKAKQGNAVDDYIVYFKNDTPIAAEFTYRDLSDSYVGYLKFLKWSTVQGRRMPLKIEVLGGIDDSTSVHEISLENYKSKKDD